MQQANQEGTKTFLRQVILRQGDERANAWLEKSLDQMVGAGLEKQFYMSFSAASRFTGKAPLALSAADLAEAEELRPGWDPQTWTLDQAARVLLVLALPLHDQEAFLHLLNQVFSAADVGELTALYRSLPVLPFPERHRERAAEGVRSNISVAFEAVALDNPYPADYLSEEAWNQLVMKAIFVGAPLHRIVGLDRRANDPLARTLSDFAHERWAAGRPVPLALWRLVGPFADAQLLPDLERLFASDDPGQQQAAALACGQSNYPPAKELLQKHPALQSEISSGNLKWETFQHP